jgi:hypothetical protein
VPRFLYWTILIGDRPTSFRAKEAADLQPTLVQLRRTHPEARMKWFERGRLWSSPEEARDARAAERARKRPSTWRPGGRHEDPRQRYKDAKKAQWTRFKEGVRKRHEARRPVSTPAASAPERDGDRTEEREPMRPSTPPPRPFGRRQAPRPAGAQRPSSRPRPPHKPRKG